jgi:hypothetical protein
MLYACAALGLYDFRRFFCFGHASLLMLITAAGLLTVDEGAGQ